MSSDFEPKTWRDGKIGNTPIKAVELNRIESGIAAASAAANEALTAATAPSALSNFTVANTAKLRGSLAKAILGTGFSTHVVIGDSLSSAFTGSVIDFSGSWWRRVQRGLAAAGVPSAGTGRVAITDSLSAPSASEDQSRITYSGAWTRTDVWYGSPASGGTVTFTSDVPGTAVDMFYVIQNSATNMQVPFTVTVDDTDHTVPSSPGWSLGTYTITGLPDTPHTVVVTADAGAANDVMITGFRVREESGVSFDNLGVKYGISAHDWRSNLDAIGPAAQCQTYSTDADVVHIALGANDMDSGRTAAQISDDIAAIRNMFPAADCVLYVEPENVSRTDYSDYVAAMRALSISLDVPLIDLSVRFGTASDIAAVGLLGPDNDHLNIVGQSDWASVVLDALRTIGPSVVA